MNLSFCHLPRSSVSRLHRGVAAIALFSAVCLTSHSALSEERKFHLSLPAESLAAALGQIGRQTDSRIIFSPEQLGGATISGLEGTFTVQEALERLLKGTNLTVKVGADGTIAISPAEVGNGAALGGQAGPSRLSSEGIEEIVVTAQKREEKAKDVAGSLTALGGDTLDMLGAKSISEYAAYVPGLTFVKTTPGLGQLTLRGVTTGVQQSSATVGTYIDETPFTPFTRTSSNTVVVPDIDTFDIQRVEVLRGPQGTLYGAGAMGGLLKFVTVEPNTEEWLGRVQIEGGGTAHGGFNDGQSAMFNAPITDKAAFRMSAYRRENAGFIDNVGDNNKDENRSLNQGGRASLLLKANEKLSLRVSSLYQDLGANGTPIVDIDPVTKQPVYGDLKQSRVFADRLDNRYQVHNLLANWDLDWATLTSSTSYGKIAIDVVSDTTSSLGATASALSGLYGYALTQNPVVAGHQHIDDKRFTQEIRLASPSNHKFEWLVGAYYTNEKTETSQTIESYTTNGETISPYLSTAYFLQLPSTYREHAGFADVDYYFTDRIDLTLGIRRTYNTQSGTQIATGVINNLLSPSSVTELHSSSKDSATTYHIAPRWRVTDDVTAYAVASSGYRPGGPNGLPPVVTTIPTSYGPDKLWNYEAGLKTVWLGGKLAVNLSTFLIKWEEIQLSSSVATPAGNFSYIANGGKASSRGLEFDTAYRPIAGLTLGFNGAYTNARLDEDAPAVSGVDGDRLPTVPKWSFSLIADYAFPVFEDWNGSVGASYSYIGERNSSYAGSVKYPNFSMDAYDTLNLRTGLTNDLWSADIFVNNVFDERGIVTVSSSLVPAGLPARASVITPLTAGLRVSRSF